MGKRTLSSVKRSCFQLHSKYVRLRDNYVCQKCGKAGTEAHHIFGRMNLSTAFIPDNGITLCAYCHKFSPHGFEQAPYTRENMEIIERKFGKERIEELDREHNQIVKFKLDDYLNIESNLKHLIDSFI